MGLIGNVVGKHFFDEDCLLSKVGLEDSRFRYGFVLEIQVSALEIRDKVGPRLVVGCTLSPVLVCIFHLARLKR